MVAVPARSSDICALKKGTCDHIRLRLRRGGDSCGLRQTPLRHSDCLEPRQRTMELSMVENCRWRSGYVLLHSCYSFTGGSWPGLFPDTGLESHRLDSVVGLDRRPECN